MALGRRAVDPSPCLLVSRPTGWRLDWSIGAEISNLSSSPDLPPTPDQDSIQVRSERMCLQSWNAWFRLVRVYAACWNWGLLNRVCLGSRWCESDRGWRAARVSPASFCQSDRRAPRVLRRGLLARLTVLPSSPSLASGLRLSTPLRARLCVISRGLPQVITRGNVIVVYLYFLIG